MLRASQLPLAAWELTSMGMLPWLAAVLLPWLVHRLLQRPRRTSDWAAVELLLTAMRRRSRRINLQQWLLLALRMAAVALVAFAAAGPVYHQFSIGSQSTLQQHVVLVLDSSFSMMVEEAGRSRFQRAQESIRELVESSDAGNAYSIIAWDRTPEDLLGKPTFDTGLVLSAVEQLSPSHSPADLSAALEAVEEAIKQCSVRYPGIGQHLIVFYSDRSQTTWTSNPETQDQWESLSKRARLSLVDLDDARRDNVAVAELRVDPTLVLRDQSVDVVALVRAHGEGSHRDVPVDLVIDGRRVGRELIDLSAGSEIEVRFPHAFPESARHAIEVSLSAVDDAMALDNRRYLVVDVRPQLRVACVAGYPGAAAEVARALAPDTDQQSASKITPEVVAQSGLTDLALDQYEALMLCSPRQLTDREARQLSRYVHEGGSLAVFLGNSSFDPELASLLPAKIALELVSGEFRFDPLDYSHPIVRPFQGRHSAGLLSTSINRYVKLTRRDSGNTSDTVMAFDTGDPALIARRVGRGRAAVLALPATLRFGDSAGEPWSSFPVSPSFLPVVRELVGFLVGDNWLEQHNLQVGETVNIPVSPHPPDDFPSLLSPSGKSIEVTQVSEHILLPETDEAGIYLRGKNSQHGQQETPYLAVNLDPRESDLSVVKGDLLPSGLAAVEQVDIETADLNWAGKSLASSLLMLALALLLLESTLAWWLGRSWG